MLGAVDAARGITCKECPRIEALVFSERNRANEYYRLLQETRTTLEVEREAYGLLEERFLLAIGAIRENKPADAKTGESQPFMGTETLRQKQERLSRESKIKRDERRKVEPVN